MMRQVIMGLSGRMLILSMQVGVEDGIEERATHDY